MAGTEASRDAGGGGRGALGEAKGFNIKETQFTFPPGFNKLAQPGPGCQKSPRRCQCLMAEARTPLLAVRLRAAPGHSVLSQRPPPAPSPVFWPYFPNRPVPHPIPSVVRLNILAWREGRRDPRPTNQSLWTGGGERGSPCLRGAEAASGHLGAERAPGDPKRRSAAPGPPLLSVPCKLLGLLSPLGLVGLWDPFCSAPCVTTSPWGLSESLPLL